MENEMPIKYIKNYYLQKEPQTFLLTTAMYLNCIISYGCILRKLSSFKYITFKLFQIIKFHLKLNHSTLDFLQLNVKMSGIKKYFT